jgi:hypothetical protein
MHEQLAMEFETPQALPDPVAGRRRGRALRDAAMQRAVEHADAVRGEWRLAALEHFRRYAQVAADREFTTGEVRQYAEMLGFSCPTDDRAWGHVAIAARKARFVDKVGFAPSVNPAAHAGPRALYRSLIGRA